MKSAKRVIIAMAVVAMGGLVDRNVEAGLCPAWACGMNSATVGDGIVFDELNVNGLTDEAGVRIRSVVLPNGKPGKLDVKGHHLMALGAPGTQPLQGPDLVGTIITVAHTDGRAYELKISKAVDGCDKCSDRDRDRCLTFWATPNTEVPYYTFLVKKISRRFDPTPPGRACTDDREPDRAFKDAICLGKNLEPEFWRGVELSAVTFEGDHYDPQTKDVRPGRKGWFNLACAGTASAKMHLLRHTEAGSIRTGPAPQRRVTSLGDRTTMLKMMTADYCGNGSTFTINGQPLLYGDVKGWYPTPPIKLNDPTQVRSFEAAWGPKGPLCMTEPRRFCKTTVEQICSTELGTPWKLPPCPTNGTLPPGTHVISANPAPSPPMATVPACINSWP